MQRRTPKVVPAKIPYPMKVANQFTLRVDRIAFSQNTVASSEWARERAHRRRYEAVFDTIPRTNSIVSIA